MGVRPDSGHAPPSDFSPGEEAGAEFLLSAWQSYWTHILTGPPRTHATPPRTDEHSARVPIGVREPHTRGQGRIRGSHGSPDLPQVGEIKVHRYESPTSTQIRLRHAPPHALYVSFTLGVGGLPVLDHVMTSHGRNLELLALLWAILAANHLQPCLSCVSHPNRVDWGCCRK